MTPFANLFNLMNRFLYGEHFQQLIVGFDHVIAVNGNWASAVMREDFGTSPCPHEKGELLARPPEDLRYWSPPKR